MVDALKDEDWLPEAKPRATAIGSLAGMNLGMMIGSIGAIAILRQQNRKQKLVQARRDSAMTDDVKFVNQHMDKPIVEKDAQKAYKTTVTTLGKRWEDDAKTAQTANRPVPERVLPGPDLSKRIWSDSDKLIADVQTSMFDTMTKSHTVDDLHDLVQPHLNPASREAATVGDKVKSNDYVTERLLRTELARMTDSVNTASYIANGISWVNIVTEPGVCARCASIAMNGPYQIDMAPLLPDDTHPNCRCVKVPALDKDDTPDMPDDVIRASGAITGKYDEGNDSFGVKRRKVADTMYKEFRAARRSSLVEKVSSNSGVDSQTVQDALTHILDSKYRLYDMDAAESGKKDHIIKNFDPDYDMALSIQRLRINKAIAPDILMLKHEQLEAKIMDEQGVNYSLAHAMANRKFDYGNAIKKWKEDHKKS